MTENMLRYYRTVGLIQTAITKEGTLDQALNDGIGILLKERGSGYVLVWIRDDRDESILHPYYWVCPVDFTGKTRRAGTGTVGRVFERQTSEHFFDYQKDDPETDRDFTGIGIGSMICLPLSDQQEQLGCIQFISPSDKPHFTEEDSDIFEIFAMLLAIRVRDSLQLTADYEDRRVLLDIRDLAKEYKNGDSVSRVLKGVNLRIYEGEFVTLLGESGCGKSTLLNIIGGLDRATEGTFAFMGRDMTHATEDELTLYRRNNIGFVFQNYNLMPNLNAKQNIDLIAELAEDPMDSLEALRRVNMEERRDYYPSQLSGGQQQRISIARALVKKPKIIMADEPTAALDYETGILILETLQEVAKAGTTLIMITHNEEITRMSDRVIRFRNGKVYEVKVNKHPVDARELVW